MPAIVRRVLLRRTVRRLRNSAEVTAEQRAHLSRVLADRDMMASLSGKVDTLAESHHDAMMFAGGETPILDWLWEHRQEILEFVKMIIDLFS